MRSRRATRATPARSARAGLVSAWAVRPAWVVRPRCARRATQPRARREAGEPRARCADVSRSRETDEARSRWAAVLRGRRWRSAGSAGLGVEVDGVLDGRTLRGVIAGLRRIELAG